MKYNIRFTRVRPRQWHDITISADNNQEQRGKIERELDSLNSRIVANKNDSNIWKVYGITKLSNK